ncbi:MAG TPA: efflux transporter outer membrane subunit [Steroidobacteraceae bacterium]|nr:efflux transporter outer membrane subunit [Steroidobacteraceae bacterium]
MSPLNEPLIRAAKIAPAGVLLALGACAAGPDFVRPPPPTTPVYSHAQLPTLAAAGLTLQAGAPVRDWWTVFGSQRLNDTMQLALQGNRDLAAAQQTLAQAAELARASTGDEWPALSLDASAGRQKLGAAALGGNFKVPPFTYFSIGPSVSYTLDFAGGVRRNVEAASARVDYQGYQLDAAYLTLTGNVALQALRIALARAQIDTVQALLKEDERNAQLVQSAFDAGSVTRVDVLSAQSQTANDQVLLPPLLQELSAARHALGVLVGRFPADWAPPDFDLAELAGPASLPVSVPSELVHQRPDILAAEAQLHEATASLGVATSNLYPRITLSATASMQSTTLGHLFDADSSAGGVLGSLTQPIFNHGALRARERAADAARQAAVAHYEQTVLSSFGQVADLLEALEHDAQLVDAQQQAVDAAAANLDLTRKSYSAGNVGILQMLDADRVNEQSQLGILRARAQRYQDEMQLLLAMGGGATLPPD